MSADPLVERLERLRRDRAAVADPAAAPASAPRRWPRLAAALGTAILLGWAVIPRAEVAPTSAARTDSTSPIASTCTIGAPALTLSGYVRAARQANVGSPIAGLVKRVFVKAGDRISAGQRLAEVVNPGLQAQLEQARAARAAKEAAVDELRNGAREEEIQQAELKVAALERDAERARLDRVRTRKLADLGLVPAQLLDAAESTAAIAEAQLRAAAAARNLLARGPRAEQVRAAEAEAALARAGVHLAEAQLAQTIVTAPFAGVVVRQSIQEGELVGVGEASSTTLIVIADMSRLVVELDVPNSSLAQVRVGQGVIVESEALSGLRLDGRVSWISPEADRHTLAVPVEVELVSPDGPDSSAVIPGLAVKVTFSPLNRGENR